MTLELKFLETNKIRLSLAKTISVVLCIFLVKMNMTQMKKWYLTMITVLSVYLIYT